MKTKLNSELAQIIRARFAAGELGKTLAYEYGVTKTTISMIVTGRIWQCPSPTSVTVPQSSINLPLRQPCSSSRN
jgi:hypothetical protein